MSMSDILATLLFLLVPLRHSKADRRMEKDTFALIHEMVVTITIILIMIVTVTGPSYIRGSMVFEADV